MRQYILAKVGNHYISIYVHVYVYIYKYTSIYVCIYMYVHLISLNHNLVEDQGNFAMQFCQLAVSGIPNSLMAYFMDNPTSKWFG